MSILFATERYAIILAVLYIDQWLAWEYIINTNSFILVLALSLLVHELRDSGVQERLHGELSHTIVLAMLVGSNTLVLIFGEPLLVLRKMCHVSSGTITSSTAATVAANMKKIERSRLTQSNPSSFHCDGGYGALVFMLLTCFLLIILSTCAMPVSTHDPVLNNLRVWSFTALSMIWFYTIEYKQLRYSNVASLTPCVLRFSCILFLTPTPVAIGGVLLMSIFLAATYTWQHICMQEISSTLIQNNTSQPTENNHHTLSKVGRTTTGAVREQSPGCVISHRAPSILSDKIDSMANAAGITSALSTMVGGGGAGSGMIVNMNSYLKESVIDVRDSTDANDETATHEAMTNDTFVDYNTLFEQVLSQQVP